MQTAVANRPQLAVTHAATAPHLAVDAIPAGRTRPRSRSAAGRSLVVLFSELLEEIRDALFDVVPDRTDRFDRLPVWVV